MASKQHWTTRFPALAPVSARLFCFPHAGGHSAAYRQWTSGLPDYVEIVSIQLPGRGSRMSERPIASIERLVEQLVSATADDLELPFVFFGHSMGAVLAWALTHALADAGRPLPRHLVLSGRRGPRIVEREPRLSPLTDSQFVTAMNSRYGGIPDELMRYPDVMELLLPAIRADVAALERFQPPPPARLPVPIWAMGGEDDRMITRDDLAAWSDETSREFRLQQFPGGHFYLEHQRGTLLAEIGRLFDACSGDRSKEAIT